jgi:hypothetical protein
MQETEFIVDMVEEKIAKGGLRWLANFKEMRRDYTIGDVTFPIYAFGGLEERGFLLSRVYSSFVTPKYKVHFLLYTTNEIDGRFLRKLIIQCKGRFGQDDWVFLELLQDKPIQREVKNAINELGDPRVGVVMSSLASREDVYSNNVLGKNLKRQLRLTEAKFEIFDIIDYMKAFAMIFTLGIVLLISLQLFFQISSVTPASLALLLLLSVIAGYPVYKSRYHTVLKLDDKGFEVLKGKAPTRGEWSDYADVSIYISPSRESFLRLHKGKDTLDLPVSRVGMSRKDAFDAVRRLVRKK